MGEEKESADSDTNSAEDSSKSSSNSNSKAHNNSGNKKSSSSTINNKKNEKKSSSSNKLRQKEKTTPTDESDENENSNEPSESESTSNNSSGKTTTSSTASNSSNTNSSSNKGQDKPLLKVNVKKATVEKDKKDEGEDDEDKDKDTEKTQFRVANTSDGNQFKLRIVPLEKLLEKPKPISSSSSSSSSKKSKAKREAQELEERKRLPQRSNRKNVSIIELSATEESTDEDDIIISKSTSDNTKTTTKTTTAAATSAVPSTQRSNRKNVSIIELSATEESTDEDDIIISKSNSNNTKTTTSTTSAVPSTSKRKVSTPKPTAVERKRSTDKISDKNTTAPQEVQAPTTSSSTSPPRVKRCAVRIKRLKAQEIKAATIAAATNRNNQKAQKSQNMNGKQRTSTRSGSSSASSSLLVAPAAASAVKSEVSDNDGDSDLDFQVKAEPKSLSSSSKQSKIERISEDDDSDADVAAASDASGNSSDSEVIPVRKKRVFNKRKKSSDQEDSDFEPKEKQKKKKRRIKRSSSGDSDRSNRSDDDDDDDEKKKNARKHIRKIIKTKDLDISTKTAAKDEEERRRRIEERQKLYNQIYEKPDSIEVNELVLDFDEETKEPLLQVDAGLLKRLKPHQVTGVKFMWDACFETLQDTQDEDKPGSGCILAHCMGLGKTLQIVALSHTLLSNARRTNIERVLVISPLSTLTNWAREFKQWMSFTRKKNIEIYDLSKFKDKPTRIYKLNEWFDEGGVCILGYDMYRILANEKAKGLKKKQRETLQKALVDPGPDLVVCDEGHLLKNEKTSISKAVNKMRTKRRIVLTGTPLQNNLKEYYCMIQFIKPNLLGTYKEYLNRFVNPISNGQYTDSTERDIRLMKHRSHILHQMLQGCIQRRDYSVLAPYLPPKHEYVVYTTLTELQQELYEFYMTVQRDLSSSDMGGKGARLFQDFQDLRRIWTHPMSLRVNSDNAIRKRVLANESDSMEDFICDDDDDDDVKSVGGSGSTTDGSDADSSKSFASGAGAGRGAKKGGGSKSRKTRNNKKDDGAGDMEFAAMSSMPEEKDDPSEWWKRFVDENELNNIHHSPKLVILMRLLVQCEAIGDKLLVFSQSLQSLDVIEHFLSLIDSKTKGYEYEGDVGDLKGVWTPGKDYFRLDGSCSVESRESMCKQFNNTSNIRARLFLISTRAGGLGINLVAANRAVIFDVSWNPSHDTQSIFRVYRFGQKKPCYIYRLIAMGTMEQKVYERQVAKQATAKRVIDEQQISRHYNQSDLQELYTYELKPSTEREIPILPKDRLFAELLTELEALLFKYHEHDSLLENEESENLNESERKAAWDEYEAEKTRTIQSAQYMSYDRNAFGNQFGNAAGSVTSNKIFGFRSDVLLQLLNMKIAKDHAELTQNQVIQLVPNYLQRLYAEMNNGDPTMYKDLLELHTTLTHPSGMYMSPLLYANQSPGAAGYYQAAGAGGGPAPAPAPAAGPPVLQPPPAQPAPGFDPNEVYEID